MAKAKEKKLLQIELTGDEADFILGLVQNPRECHPSQEPENIAALRKSIWDALYPLVRGNEQA